MIELLKKCPRLEELYLNTNLVDIDALFATRGSAISAYCNTTTATTTVRKALRAARIRLRPWQTTPSLQRLTTLRLHPGRDTTIELTEFDALVRSPHLPGLTHLQVHMTNFGDEGARGIIESGILRRLETLDIGYGNMTDDGRSPAGGMSRPEALQLLDVSRNALTVAGIAALEDGIRVVANEQHAVDETDYLYEGDLE